MNVQNPTVYLGDAVYASYDGFHIWLHLDSHLNPRLIALEPQVLDNLVAFAIRVNGQVPNLLEIARLLQKNSGEEPATPV